jgi:hypothetical protein
MLLGCARICAETAGRLRSLFRVSRSASFKTLAELRLKKLAWTLGSSLGHLGWPVIRISLPRHRVLMLRNPLNRVILRNKALDYFRFAIGPQNIDPPARSGIFPSHVSWSLLEHPSNMRLRRPSSSQLFCHNQTADSALALAAASMSGAAISLLKGLGAMGFRIRLP